MWHGFFYVPAKGACSFLETGTGTVGKISGTPSPEFQGWIANPSTLGRGRGIWGPTWTFFWDNGMDKKPPQQHQALPVTKKRAHSKYLLPAPGVWRESPDGRVLHECGASAPAHRPRGQSSSGRLFSAWYIRERRVQLGEQQ